MTDEREMRYRMNFLMEEAFQAGIEVDGFVECFLDHYAKKEPVYEDRDIGPGPNGLGRSTSRIMVGDRWSQRDVDFARQIYLRVLESYHRRSEPRPRLEVTGK